MLYTIMMLYSSLLRRAQGVLYTIVYSLVYSLYAIFTWDFPSQFIQINQGVKGHTTRAPPGVPRTRAGLEPGTSRFSTQRINHYATRGGRCYNVSLTSSK